MLLERHSCACALPTCCGWLCDMMMRACVAWRAALDDDACQVNVTHISQQLATGTPQPSCNVTLQVTRTSTGETRSAVVGKFAAVDPVFDFSGVRSIPSSPMVVNFTGRGFPIQSVGDDTASVTVNVSIAGVSMRDVVYLSSSWNRMAVLVPFMSFDDNGSALSIFANYSYVTPSTATATQAGVVAGVNPEVRRVPMKRCALMDDRANRSGRQPRTLC